MKITLAVLSGIALLVCTLSAFFYLWGSLTMPEYKSLLFVSSILYFVFATLWVTRKSPAKR